jgi:hypothetical protein
MSSILRGITQTPARSRYFLAIEAYVPTEPEGAVDAGDSAVTFQNGGSPPGEFIVEGTITINYVGFAAEALLKDLGRGFTVVDTSNRHIARYRYVQRVNGSATEGVGDRVDPLDDAFGCFYVKVWSADGQGVFVVRTG